MSKAATELRVIDGLRTPFALANREFSQLDADELGRLACTHLLGRHPQYVSQIEEVIFGCVGPGASLSNIARVIALRSGLPEKIPALTVQRNCGSGMEALAQVFHRRGREVGSSFLVGGTESMSSYPFYFSDKMKSLFTQLNRAKSPLATMKAMMSFRLGHLSPRIALLEGLTDPTCGLSMGRTAENLAREFGIDRESQDAFALQSHQRAAAARDRLQEETIVCVTDKGALRDDSSVRPQQDMEALGRLRTVFTKNYGTVTAGNACAVSDGAVALLLTTSHQGQEVESLGVVKDCTTIGLAPSRMGLGPVFAIAALLQRNNLVLDDIDLFEINEAFSAQVLACLEASKSRDFCTRELGLKQALGEIHQEQLNVNGGAIALGHPVGASGARIILTLLKELKRRGLKRGIAALCIGGGQGSAVLLERTN